MILVVGPSPSLQRRMTFSRVEMNHVNRAVEVEQLASGKGVNCVRALKQLDEAALTLLFSGGPNGVIFQKLLEEEALAFRSVETVSSTRSCSTICELDRSSVTELIENANPVTQKEAAQYLSEFRTLIKESQVVVLIGTLPPGVPQDLYSQMIRIAHESKIPSIVDTQGASLLEAAKANPFVVKPNRKELASALGVDCVTEKDLFNAMKRLQAMGPQWVVVTDESKTVFFTDGGELQKMIPPTISVKNPMGSGDSMCAGMAWGLLQGKDFQNLIKLGIACGAANAASDGYGRIDPVLVKALLPSILTD